MASDPHFNNVVMPINGWLPMIFLIHLGKDFLCREVHQDDHIDIPSIVNGNLATTEA
jgi:hypothetical protein